MSKFDNLPFRSTPPPTLNAVCAIYTFEDLFNASISLILPILVTELRERNLGKCVGKSVQWLKDNIECPEKTIDDRMFSDAESRRDVWNRLLPFFRTFMESPAENIILVSHGDLLSVFNTMFLGLDVESLNGAEIFGLAGGVSRMFINDEGKRFIKKISDMSYIQ